MVITPSTNRIPATGAPFNDSLVIRFALTQEPGLYRILIPAAIATCTNGSAPEVEIPFVVLGRGQENSMNALSDSDLAQLQTRVGMSVVNSKDELAMAFSGETPGREVWKWLVLGALFLVIAEGGVTRWISVQRRFSTAAVVTLKSPVTSATNLKNLAGGGRGISRM